VELNEKPFTPPYRTPYRTVVFQPVASIEERPSTESRFLPDVEEAVDHGPAAFLA